MSVTFARGFRAGAAACGVKTGVAERPDVALIVSDAPCEAAAVYTTNAVVAAPIVVTRRHLAAARPRVVVVNSGNANACTGDDGERAAEAMAEAAARACGVAAVEVVVASTGVIGVPLPIERVARGIAAIAPTADGGGAAARAILTTDTRPKLAEREVALAAGTLRVGGMAKGAGMIHPNLATLLCFLTTDAAIDGASLRRALETAVAQSFNAITVDGDTSTNDMVLLLANGRSGVQVGAPDLPRFADALTVVCIDLAKGIVADAEGATKVFEVSVTGARGVGDARAAARTIASSNLVKTAVHGADPNWGRVLAAAGRSGAGVDHRRATVRVGGHAVFERGAPRGYDVAAVTNALRAAEILIEVDLGLGSASARAWGCDLSTEYVRINAEYTT